MYSTAPLHWAMPNCASRDQNIAKPLTHACDTHSKKQMFLAHSAGVVESLQREDFPSQCPDMTPSNLMVGTSNAGALGNAEYSFIAIASRFTQARSGST